MMTAIWALLLGGVAVPAQDAPRVALMYSDYRPSDRTFLDAHVPPLGWRLDRWNVIESRRLMNALPQYDLLITSPCWNFIPGKEFAPDHRYPWGWSPRLLREWVEEVLRESDMEHRDQELGREHNGQ